MVIELNKYEGTDDSLEDKEESSEGGGNFNIAIFRQQEVFK